MSPSKQRWSLLAHRGSRYQISQTRLQQIQQSVRVGLGGMSVVRSEKEEHNTRECGSEDPRRLRRRKQRKHASKSFAAFVIGFRRTVYPGSAPSEPPNQIDVASDSHLRKRDMPPIG